MLVEDFHPSFTQLVVNGLVVGDGLFGDGMRDGGRSKAFAIADVSEHVSEASWTFSVYALGVLGAVVFSALLVNISGMLNNLVYGSVESAGCKGVGLRLMLDCGGGFSV